jgi:hypothetical protein
MSNDYNGVYDHLVASDEDIVGLVDYAIYKQDKRDWIMLWRNKKSTVPGQDELNIYTTAQLSEGQRFRYREMAKNLLATYSLQAIEDEKP